MKIKLVFIIFCMVGYSVSAQTLDDQFANLKENSGTYKSYKVIEQTELADFWKVVQDSVSQSKQKLSEANTQITNQQSEISKLKTTITEKDEAIGAKDYLATHIEALGIDIEKESFKIITYTIIIALLVALGIIIYKYKDNNKVAKKKTGDYDRLHEEFEEYKRNALEKQMKLRRDLQTERNKLDDIRSN
ncbi:hypothetical protein LVD15_17095 [Fulvivirga maritima]|uniref:hypothetical protein n=1 Tax=Fulvivirga maritima TaxID=2904247 RepID=UPI001F325064|nr:hypothetical protein [Fulvivirga maritima]UII25017.1 hypothetical protein LVD15_17095 [Fulvivirga maritima]